MFSAATQLVPPNSRHNFSPHVTSCALRLRAVLVPPWLRVEVMVGLNHLLINSVLLCNQALAVKPRCPTWILPQIHGKRGALL